MTFSTTLLAAPVQEAYLKASNAGAGDTFGYSVAISGNTAVVGAYQEDSVSAGVNGDQADNGANAAGAAYVFVRSGTTWTQQAYLKASHAANLDSFGCSVAISGETIVVGARGESSCAEGVDGDESIDNCRAAGAAYVFVRSGTSWSQQAYLKASNTGRNDNFGHSVAIFGNRIVVGSPWEASANGSQADDSLWAAGAAYVFSRTDANWTQEAYLKPKDTGTGDRFGDRFGEAVGISGSYIVVGAPEEDGSATVINGDETDNSATGAGAAYVFFHDGTSWSQQAYLKPANAGSGDLFGAAVAIENATVVVGAPFEDGGATSINGISNDDLANAGAAYVFVRNASDWTQQAYLKADNAGAYDRFGYSVGLSGETALVGAPYEASSATGVNGNGTIDPMGAAGAAYLFRRSGSTWVADAYLKASNTGSGDNFGLPVAISGEVALVSSAYESSSTTTINGDADDDSAVGSGAVYAFRGLATVSASPIRIERVAKFDNSMTVSFTATAGLTDWIVSGSAHLQGWPDDLTPASVISELSFGSYQAVVDVTGKDPKGYFLRIGR
ncbi:MAG: FG-GAP repeat protein [Verrucomicrobiales bacterium]